jgi:cysteine dioxygenase
MKILRGNLTETRYDFPEGTEPQEMRIKSQAVRPENAVAYMADELGLHRVSNEGSDFAVSLHRMYIPCTRVYCTHVLTERATVYTPPNVAKGGCYIFDQKTGKRSHVAKCGYYSAYGKLLKE